MEIFLLVIKFFFILWSLVIASAIAILSVRLYQINRTSEISTIGYLLPREKRALEQAKKKDVKGRWSKVKEKLDFQDINKVKSSLSLCESFIVEVLNEKGIKGKDLKNLLKEAGFKGIEGVKILWEGYKILYIEQKKDYESLKKALSDYIAGIEDMIDFGLVQ